MPKFGYLFRATDYDGFSADYEWMKQYGCSQILIEDDELRPLWKQLMSRLKCDDLIFIGQFKNVVHNFSELSEFIDFCVENNIRIISLRDKYDSHGVLFDKRKTMLAMDKNCYALDYISKVCGCKNWKDAILKVAFCKTFIYYCPK